MKWSSQAMIPRAMLYAQLPKSCYVKERFAFACYAMQM